jgi:hypothetical protein
MRLRLDVLHAGVVAFQFREKFRIGAALQHLGQKASSRPQHFARELGSRLDQRHDFQLIGLLVAGRIRRHVGEHDIGAAVEHLVKVFGRFRIEEVELAEHHARDRRHLENVDRDHLALPVRRADALGRDLAPAAGRGTEVDHAAPGLEHAMLVVDLDQLEGGARAQSLTLGTRHIGIVELAFEPALLRDGALLLRLEPHRQRTFVPGIHGR